MAAIARRSVLSALPGALAVPRTLRAQGGWPQRPVRVVVPYARGGGTDIFVRSLTSNRSRRALARPAGTTHAHRGR